MSAADDLDPLDAAVAPDVAAELPGLLVRYVVVGAPAGSRTPRSLRRRLEEVSTRFRGAEAIALRTRPVPRAYRTLFRQLGLDPDVVRTPVEQVAVDRLVRGELHTGDRVADAVALATIETGVPVVALAEAALRGALVLRPARAGERLRAGSVAHDLPAGRLVLADDEGPVAELFGRTSARHAPARAPGPVRLIAIQAPGVPRAHVGEALWLAATGVAED